MLELGIDGDLICWSQSFMTDQRLQLVVDGFKCEEKLVDTGVPQESPVSPILFAIYLSGIFKAVEEAVPTKSLFFVDDLGFMVSAESVSQACERLQQTEEVTIEWGQNNAVLFDAEKIEAMLFTHKKEQRLREQMQAARVKIEGHEITFKQETSQWLGIWLDAGLELKVHHQNCLHKARKAETRL